MKTYPLKDQNEFQFGFEIENVYISLKKIVNLLSTIDNVSNIRQRRLFDFTNENLIEFDYMGDRFIVFEPFGDNSRYWICPYQKSNRKVDITRIENVFEQYHPPIINKLLGDLISLNFRKQGNKND